MFGTSSIELQQQQLAKSIRRLCDQSVFYLKTTAKIPIERLDLAQHQRELDSDLVGVLVNSWLGETMEIHRNREMKAIVSIEEWNRLTENAKKHGVSINKLFESDQEIKIFIWSGQHRLKAARKFAARKKLPDEDNYWIVGIYTEGEFHAYATFPEKK